MLAGAPPSKLPVAKLTIESLRLPFDHRRELLRFASVPFIAMLAAMLVLRALAPGGPSSGDAMRRMLVVSPITAIVLFEFVLPSYAVTVTRLIADGAAALEQKAVLAYSTDEFRYALVAMMMTLSVGMAVVAIAVLIYTVRTALDLPVAGVVALGIGATAVLLFVAVRMILLFPAVAAGVSTSLRAAWTMSRANGPRLFLILLLTALPYAVPTLILRAAASNLRGYPAEIALAATLRAMVTLSWTTTLGWQALAFQILKPHMSTAASPQFFSPKSSRVGVPARH